MNINGDNSNTIFTRLLTNSLSDINQSVSINLMQDTIDLVGTNILVNHEPIEGVKNPLESDLNIGSFDITGLPAGQTLVGLNSAVIFQGETVNENSGKLINFTGSTVSPSITNIDGLLRIPEVSTEKLSSTLQSSYIDMLEGGIGITSLALSFNGNSIVSTPYGAELEASSFKKTGGTNLEYLMGDGSVLQYSANSGNSNFYLYKSHTNTPTPPPTSGFVYYNNANQSLATIVYISHITDDGIDIDVFFDNISQLNDLYIQQKSVSGNYIRYGITGSPTITIGSMIAIPVAVSDSAGTGSTSFGTNEPILLSFFTNTIETDTRLSAVESAVTTLQTKTQNQTAIAGTTTLAGILDVTTKIKTPLLTDIGAGTAQIFLTPGLVEVVASSMLLNNEEVVYNNFTSQLVAQSFRKTGGLTTQFLKANGDVDSHTYIEAGPINNSSVPYINTTGAVSSNATNLYVQAGVNTIQSALDAVVSGNAYSIQLSASSFIENITLSKQNYMLSGASCPLFAPSTQLLGTITIGKTGVLTTRQKIKDILFTSNLTFFSDATNQALRTTISNCEFQGSITFPALAVAGTFIYFFDCSFSGLAGTYSITFPATQNYGIVFTRCNFSNQTFVNNATSAVLNTFRDCTGMSSITLSPATYFGINALTTAVSNVTTTSLVLGGSNANLLLGDGSGIASNSFVSTIVGPTGYSGRKFMTTIPVATISGVITNGNLIGTLNPVGGNAFVANECKIGDIYKITIVGVLDSQSTTNIATFTFGFLGSTNTVANTVGIGFTSAPFKMEVEYQILTATTASFSGFFNVRNTGAAPQTYFFGNSNKNTVVSLTASSSLTATYTHASAGQSLTINGFNMIKY
jgi:hypothetical protein